jgi:hypothetical protein
MEEPGHGAFGKMNEYTLQDCSTYLSRTSSPPFLYLPISLPAYLIFVPTYIPHPLRITVTR